MKNKQNVKKQKRLFRYGISEEKFNYLLMLQGKRCKVCQEILNGDRYEHIDHNHLTKQVRGILCHNCNVGLGHFKDRVDLLERAIKYLREGENVSPR